MNINWQSVGIKWTSDENGREVADRPHNGYLPVKSIPDALSWMPLMEGYACRRPVVKAVMTERINRQFETIRVTYQVVGQLDFHQGDGVVTLTVNSGIFEDVNEAIADATVDVAEVSFNGKVESGRGQQNTCRSIAERLRQEHALYVSTDTIIAVPYETRGGRNGRFAKDARRRFTVADLDAPAPIRITAKMDFWDDYRRQWTDLGRRRQVVWQQNGHVEVATGWQQETYPTYQVGNFRVIGDPAAPMYRIELRDWQRLTEKAARVD